MSGPPRHVATVEEVFADFKSRRAGIIKAFTVDFEEFYQRCDPEEVNLCLYGLPNGSWEVRLPSEELPPNFPEPLLAINFPRDGMQEKDWLALLAVHSDSWLISMAFHLGSLWYFDQDKRKRLFAMINDLPTIHEIVTGEAKKPTNKESSVPSNSSSNSEPSSNEVGEDSEGTLTDEGEAVDEEDHEENEEFVDEEDHEENEEFVVCGACEDNNITPDEFSICCDSCQVWFHGTCVDMTLERAESIEQYKCPFCEMNND